MAIRIFRGEKKCGINSGTAVFKMEPGSREVRPDPRALDVDEDFTE